MVLVFFQAWLGSIVVSTNLTQWVVTVHMLLALVILGIAIYTYNYAKQLHKEPSVIMYRIAWLKGFLLFTIIISILQIILGTEVREAVDSIAKKLKVVDAVCEMVGIKNIETKHTRVEDIKNKKFDYAISRAVAPLKDLWKWAGPILLKKPDQANALICLKGGDLAQEIFESLLRPKMVPVYRLFAEPYFHEKFILHVTK